MIKIVDLWNKKICNKINICHIRGLEKYEKTKRRFDRKTKRWIEYRDAKEKNFKFLGEVLNDSPILRIYVSNFR